MASDILSLFGKDVKKIGFFGIGRSNLYLLSQIDGVEVTLRSDKIIDKGLLPGGIQIHKICEGADALADIDEDVLVLSPSVRRDRPELADAEARGVLLTSDCELFFSGDPKKVFAVTGSDGKSTTATLTGMLLKESFPGVATVGNIGVPFLKCRSNADAYAAELSSFQLTYATPVSLRAAITNITENHLNWHSSFEEYKAAKLKLIDNAHQAVLSADDEILCEELAHREVFAVTSVNTSSRELARRYRAECCYTCEDGYVRRCSRPLFSVDSVRSKAKHNLKNLLTALALTDGYVSADHALRVAEDFTGLPHRCELFLSHRGVDYINSSIDTTPSRCAATLSSLGRTCVVLLGGRGKGSSLLPLIPALERYAKAAVLFGECADELYDAISEVIPAFKAKDLRCAVMTASGIAKEGEAILLSPAATSYDAYSSFEERGDEFKKIATELI